MRSGRGAGDKSSRGNPTDDGAKLRVMEAPEILEVSGRTIRRFGRGNANSTATMDSAQQQDKPRMSLETIEKMLQPYRQEYADHHLHFHHKLMPVACLPITVTIPLISITASSGV